MWAVQRVSEFIIRVLLSFTYVRLIASSGESERNSRSVASLLKRDRRC